ncbi:Rna exonuclease [Thalictrum thalictroides]|uniref:Rna exonuclease n=1 Tax=Thalictrum thalictroides TaxID=46969 RepID=A0A7J6VRB0_THATH|nr:Rna exonuclease [Thalictrum thalictroides]
MAGKEVMIELESIRSVPPALGKQVETKKSSWSSLFQQGNACKLKTTLKLYKPTVVNGVAEVPDDVIQKGHKEWEDYLVGSFVGKRLPFPLVKNVLQKEWKIQNFDMVADEEVFYFKFQNEEDKMTVIEKGPIFIAGRLFVIRLWSPEIEKGRNLISTVPIWVKLEGVPKRLWSEEGLGFIASLIGRPVCLDEATEKKTRLKFARVCIEVDLECSFPKLLKVKIREEEVEIKVEYTWIPSRCTKCASFGHLTNRCVRKVATVWQKSDGAGPSCMRNSQGQAVETSSPTTTVNDVFSVGERRSSPISPKSAFLVLAKDNIASKNRFECLQEREEEEEQVQDTAMVVYNEPEAIIAVVDNSISEIEPIQREEGVQQIDNEPVLVEEGKRLQIEEENCIEPPLESILAEQEGDINKPEEEAAVNDQALVVVGDENMEYEDENTLPYEEDTISVEEVEESPPEMLELYNVDKLMYAALVEEGGEEEEDDLQDVEEEIEVFKDHIIKQLQPVHIPATPRPLRNIKMEAKAKALVSAGKRQKEEERLTTTAKKEHETVKKGRGRPKGLSGSSNY